MMSPYGTIDVPFLRLLMGAMTQYIMKTVLVEASKVAPVLLVRPFEKQANAKVTASEVGPDFQLTFGGTVSLTQVQNSYKVAELFGLKFYVQCGNNYLLTCDCVQPAWHVPVVKEQAQSYNYHVHSRKVYLLTVLAIGNYLPWLRVCCCAHGGAQRNTTPTTSSTPALPFLRGLL